ncbi:TetR/AcrR family transcriptional regulator [Kribbella shirazensis]|jgi:AcrR family transcriptional regulator|uniref:AcrR family transcriptional regulator n=1 Tax=Kribbella shirazensis TaxID=1105143 RepID=A0A7X5VB41_9ACTN|nr:TetR/AcrR family transcriptional regulator C-terminal domain-containing protein [Kribbella shirazensis]NIK57541.1 AcrR family transcriptional regulator [Kribbella shirazensis]
MTEDRGDVLPPGLELAWGVQPAQRRGPKPALSVEQIVATGIEFGDRYGFEAVSLQRIAAQLGVTTNAMYRYVRSKEELIVLVHDKAVGLPPELPSGWRAAAIAWVDAQVKLYENRPWLLDVPIRGAPVTPNLLRWLEVMLAALAETGLSQHDNLGCLVLLDGHVRNYANLARQLGASDSTPVQAEQVGRFLVPRLIEGGYPTVASLYLNHEYEDELDDDLDFGLARILDGIEVLISKGV